MIVRVRREELIGLLSNHLGRQVKDFVITPPEPSIIGKACRAGVVEPLDKHLKVSNIKAIREVARLIGSPITLMEGKYAMENWLKWIAFVDEHNRMPISGYGSEESYGKLK